MKRSRVIVSMAAALLLTASCTGDNSDPASSTPPSQESASASASENTGREDSQLSIKGAQPIRTAARVIGAVPGIADDGRWQSVAGITQDGQVLLVVNDAPTGEQLTDAEVVIADPRNPDRGTRIDQTPSGRPYQSYGFDSSAKHVVWMTSASTRLDSWPWTLKVQDRETGSTTDVARSRKVSGEDPPQVPGYTGPTVAGEHVYWAEVHGTPRSLTVQVMGCQIASCDPEVIAPYSGLPVATEAALYVARPIGMQVVRAKEPFRIDRVDRKTGRVSTEISLGKDPDAAPTGLAASTSAIAWTHREGNRQAITIQATGSDEPVTITSRVEGIFAYPIATERFVVWAEASGTSPEQVGGYLYDLEDEKLYKLGNKSGLYSVYAAGDFVTWQEQPKGSDRPVTVVARMD